jgi:hypothetical protein
VIQEVVSEQVTTATQVRTQELRSTGVDKVGWWLQAKMHVVSMAPAVFAVVSECLASVLDDKEAANGVSIDAQTASNDHEIQPEIVDKESLLKRAFDCAAAWFKLGVLLTTPCSVYE